ncbi:LysR family transcriptional regulator [Actinomadura madurae]|uniref:LysR family transcriptional regulator n=1 Tax=Actinomadura madurae TaxID=1993 RepID=UPI0020D23367|nr:LysR family transcriptional regulator [Actinomadura madurae]MCP9948238.1 LysR family transcriptional regulator [Actinomadura madurae]MCP9965005.1 LysR family transcriptional regulator [Actinomadura madurae]MCP9977501.1 LysR family transcriptional regulator [Actinomadura madurae]MCQ0011000.1 LysR family transcriptional regulator [Actinomadura madurae]MCQ0013682.1 LysR family transcriptional regulator [Actinomadura madurae]
MIDLSKLRHAVAVAAAGSYTAAAQTIPISQPALTRSIQSLERQYGLTLFERDKSGTRLTPDGIRFISQSERLLRHAQALEEDIQRLAAGHGATISFGIGPASAFTFLPGALPCCSRAPPTSACGSGSAPTARCEISSGQARSTST